MYMYGLGGIRVLGRSVFDGLGGDDTQYLHLNLRYSFECFIYKCILLVFSMAILVVQKLPCILILECVCVDLLCAFTLNVCTFPCSLPFITVLFNLQ